nr:MAG: putative capsid protein [Arizlama virus]
MMPYGGMPIVIQSGGGQRRSYRRRYRVPRRVKRQMYQIRRLRRVLADQKRSNLEGRIGSNLFGTNDDWSTLTPDQKTARRALRWRGKGDYKSFLKYAARGLGSLAGGAMGLMTGGVGGALAGAKGGWDTGAGFSKWAGWGDYGPVSTNQIMGGGAGPMQTATVNQSMSGDIIINNSEFIGNVSATATGAGTSGFQVTKYELNAGLQGTFPFLSQLAQNYQMYQFAGLIFQYKPTSGEGNSVNANAIGKVIMATQYDPDALDFIDSIQMENYEWSNASKPSCGMLHGVETLPSQKATNQLYIRTGASQKNKLFTDLGSFYIATEGIPFNAAGTVNCGELWVTYTIKLTRANLYGSLLGYNIPIFWQQRISNVVTDNPQNTLAMTIDCVPDTITKELHYDVTWPTNISLGYFAVSINSERGFGADTINGNAVASALTNCTAVSPSTSSSHQTNNGSDSTTAVEVKWFQVNAPGNSQASVRITFQCVGGLVMVQPTNYTIVIQGSNGIVYQNPV